MPIYKIETLIVIRAYHLVEAEDYTEAKFIVARGGTPSYSKSERGAEQPSVLRGEEISEEEACAIENHYSYQRYTTLAKEG